MSVAILAVQPSYNMECYLHKSLSSSDSDSDAGYGTPAESVVAKELTAPVLAVHVAAEEMVSSADETPDGPEAEGTLVDSDLQERVVKQVEWYFSDENLLKDSFLMKHINRNKQGYVSLKLVASLRKVKTLSKDWKFVLESLKQSDILALNEEETKIRRLSPAPQVNFSHIAKTLLITNYPDQEPNLTDIEERFGKYGELVQVRLVHPGRAIPLDVKPSKAQHLSLGKELCILIEYAREGTAKSALRKIGEQQSWRDEMKVHLLGEKKSADQEVKDQEDKSPRLTTEGRKKRKGEKNSLSQSQQRGTPHSKDTPLAPQYLRNYSPSLRNSHDGIPVRQILQHKASPPSASSTPDSHRNGKFHGAKGSPELSRKFLQPETRKDYSSDSGLSCSSSRSSSESPKQTPETSRKFFSGGSAGEFSWRSADRHSHTNNSIIRQPLGPDGTRGFIKQRLNPISIK